MAKKAHFIIAVFILAAVLLPFWPAAAVGLHQAYFTVGKNEFWIDNNRYLMDVYPYIKNSRVYLPLRFAAYAVGLRNENIVWDSNLRTAILIYGDKKVKVKPGSSILYVNEQQIIMDVVPEIYQNRLMLPLRWIAEALGARVEWDGKQQKVTVIYEDKMEDTALIENKENKIEYSADKGEVIVKQYTWEDKYKGEWNWKVNIPQTVYDYYRSKPRRHEELENNYKNDIARLREKENRLNQELEYWYWYYRIYPGDSPQEAAYKYRALNEVIARINREKDKLILEYEQIRSFYQKEAARMIKEGYVPYVTEEVNFKLVAKLAESLVSKFTGSMKDKIEFVASFVQEALPYVPEEGEYPKYPVETLIEGGDCEDKAILLAAFLKAMGYKTALIIFDGDPGHAAVGVECPGAFGSYFEKDGVKYFYIETTNKGWRLGQIPPEYKGKSALVFPVP
ncbi:Copper amine oxidase N-terminal domain-containing protein [Thermosyntropha lipolytica DSM 11003]|uniref:Copper amine oxidase N-terminal domain-containing protein n=1 Tax=Thermosyntropha lipolytica DSM 11003 TaxID=1123382 RepID=A0A1M5QAM1_9FIRM|nr:stalk domain-containing protein [Thermosyntropha lipolytica]SHH10970.1 Copper amine oxidase N-terminal domain-containing protein [Thermosyntropha lipolytica DSM 11003]